MTQTVEAALDSLTIAVNLSTGLYHLNDMDRAKETFVILHNHGEILLKSEIVAWAETKGWSPEHADQLGSLAQQIGEGKKAIVTDGPWWKDDIYDRWSGKIE